jgi:hypothetical protein
MTKPDWKTKPHERMRMTLQQENEQLKKRIEVLVHERDKYLKTAQYLRSEHEKAAQDRERYTVLREKDVMVLDGEPKYLKGEDLDKYCDEENKKVWGVSLPSMVGYLQQIAKAQQTSAQIKPTKLLVQPQFAEAAKKILEANNYGNDT